MRITTNSWLIVERLEHWEVDRSNGFKFFGLSVRYRKYAAEISEGDFVFCYVSSGISAFADVRMVTATGLKPLKVQSYDTAYAYHFSTASVFVLPRERWVPVKSLASDLDLTKGKADYRSMFQISLRRLTDHDSALIRDSLDRSAASLS